MDRITRNVWTTINSEDDHVMVTASVLYIVQILYMCVMYIFTPILGCTKIMFTLYAPKIIYPVNGLVHVLYSGDIV